MTRMTLALVAAAAMFGAVSAAQAYGTRIGPLGQPLGGPEAWRGRPPSVYAYTPRHRLDRYYYNHNGRRIVR